MNNSKQIEYKDKATGDIYIVSVDEDATQETVDSLLKRLQRVAEVNNKYEKSGDEAPRHPETYVTCEDQDSRKTAIQRVEASLPQERINLALKKLESEITKQPLSNEYIKLDLEIVIEKELARAQKIVNQIIDEHLPLITSLMGNDNTERGYLLSAHEIAKLAASSLGLEELAALPCMTHRSARIVSELRNILDKDLCETFQRIDRTVKAFDPHIEKLVIESKA